MFPNKKKSVSYGNRMFPYKRFTVNSPIIYCLKEKIWSNECGPPALIFRPYEIFGLISF